jgi:actin-like ATPase involved in cell morphogenesis
MVRTQEQLRHHHCRHHHGEGEPRIEPIERCSVAADLKHHLDEIVEEIESVLERNADEIVHG